MLDNPNSVLTKNPPNVTTTTRLHVSTTPGVPDVGGGTSNTAFLVGTKDGPNADPAHVAATFWLQTLAGDTEPTRLQYSQTVLLNFNQHQLAAHHGGHADQGLRPPDPRTDRCWPATVCCVGPG